MKKPLSLTSKAFNHRLRADRPPPRQGLLGRAQRPLESCALILLGSALQWSSPVMAIDWGYDDQPAAKQAAAAPNSATAAAATKSGKSRALASPGRQVAPGRSKKPAIAAPDETSLNSEPSPPKREAPPKELTLEEIAARQKTRDLKSWMQIYALCASSASEDDRNQVLGLQTLNEDLRKKLEKLTFEKLEKDIPQYRGVTAIWQPISEKIVADIDYKESYRLLFRSLLRHALGHMDQASPEAEPLHEILGPTRIAEMGPPILSEDAINAYSDMTCFLYSKNHPDHTLAGDDNKQLFADVIRQRYHDAPNPEAKKAMCNFDLTWAAFRCRYLDSSEADKGKLIASISAASAAPAENTGPGSARAKTDNPQKNRGNQAMTTSPKMLKIFAIGPWAEKILAAATPAATATAQAMDMSKPLDSTRPKADLESGPKTTPVAAKMNQMSEPTK